MEFGTSKQELKVGIFVAVGLVMLVVAILLVGNFQTWRHGYVVTVRFSFIDGVKVGAPVRFAGVAVGEVKDLKFTTLETNNVTVVDVNCWIHNDIRIPGDSSPLINTMGLLGEKYIEIMPGKDVTAFWSERQIVEGINPLPMHEVSRVAYDILTKLGQSIEHITRGEGTLGKLLYDESLYNEMNAFVVDTKKDLSLLINDADFLVKDVQQNPWKLLFKPKEKPAKKK
jgi:phospholipid/cholesterol/gamma-HCH transport system substrate-binding protein